MDVGEKLKRVRREHGLSQSKAAQLVHMTQRSWARYEAGDRTPPEGVLELFCIKLGIPYHETFG